MSAGAQGGRKRAIDLLEFQGVVLDMDAWKQTQLLQEQ